MEQMRPPLDDPTPKNAMDVSGLVNEKDIISTFENMGSSHRDAFENLVLHEVKVTFAGEANFDKETHIQSRKRHPKVLAPVSPKVLRSRSREKSKTAEPEVMEVKVGANEERTKKSRRGRKRGMNKIPVNEFSRIRTHLKYLLQRIKYEQNLIDAYSGEGWKGQSLEKIKPEKELQRAKSQIFRHKLKIRVLFQQLDELLTQGRLPEALFDSEGQIDSEDIFCAKCGSKDLTIHNDIILCDGACERGFHQFCLEPPLLKDDIPPGDEGWLCPGCDCKVDCIKILNDFQGSNLTLLDKWEKVYPEEAAAALSGKNVEDNCGLPSDDSEDDDYNPDNPELDDDVLENESNSDKSDYFSASDGLAPNINNQQILGLPSDDSEDDEFDPDAPEPDHHSEQEISSPDFSSDSEDLDAIIDKGESHGNDDGHDLSASDRSKHDIGANGRKFEVSTVRRRPLNDELAFLLESNAGPVSGKRHVERLDYKKLHDETFGNATTDSSDEEYGETGGPKRRKNSIGRAILVSINSVQGRKSPASTEGSNEDQNKSEHMAKVNGHKKVEVEDSENILGGSCQSSSEAGCSAKKTTRPYKRLSESVIQVSKWFENARWSFHHSSRMDSIKAESASRNHISAPQVDERLPQLQPSVLQNPSCNGAADIVPSQASTGEEQCDNTQMW